MPRSSQRSIAARSRMPPPSWILRPPAWQIAATAAPLTERPANAPSRSTTCSHSKPRSANSCACAAGSLLNTVALAISPRTRRTQAPPFRSIAGKRIIAGSPGRRVEALVIVMSGNDPPFDLGVARVGAPAAIAEALVEPDRGLLGIAQIEVQDGEAEVARLALELADEFLADAAAAPPGRD